jgi:hypothetical protein
VRRWFGKYGMKPAAKADQESGCWKRPADELVYGRTHFESLRSDETEVFRFLWENRTRLDLDSEAYMRVMSVRPCLRVVQDGFTVRETVAEYKQVIQAPAGILSKELVPKGMPADLEVALHGGGTLVFDEYGRLKYHISQRPRGRRQAERLKVLWEDGLLREHRAPARRPEAFARLHLRRAVSAAGQPEEW